MKFRCKATGMSFDGCHTTNSLKRIKAMFQCCDTQECHCTVLHHGCRFFRHLFLSRKYMIQTEAVEDVYRANWKKNIWIHAVRKSMHRGDDYPSNTHTKKKWPGLAPRQLERHKFVTWRWNSTWSCYMSVPWSKWSQSNLLHWSPWGGETGPDTFLGCTCCSMMFLVANLYELWYLNMTWSEPILSKVAQAAKQVAVAVIWQLRFQRNSHQERMTWLCFTTTTTTTTRTTTTTTRTTTTTTTTTTRTTTTTTTKRRRTRRRTKNKKQKPE